MDLGMAAAGVPPARTLSTMEASVSAGQEEENLRDNYIALLKALALRLTPNTVHFFFKERDLVLNAERELFERGGGRTLTAGPSLLNLEVYSCHV